MLRCNSWNTVNGGGRVACAAQKQRSEWRWNECTRAKSPLPMAWGPEWPPCACGQAQRTQWFENELRSVQAEAYEMSASRLQQGLEAEIVMETIRGEKVDAETQLSSLRQELAAQASRSEAAAAKQRAVRRRNPPKP